MSGHAAEQILKAEFTLAAVNAQIDALNVIYGYTATAKEVPHLKGIYTDDLIAPDMILNTPALAVMVGVAPATTPQVKHHGYRRIDVPVLLAYAGDSSVADKARRDVGVTLEAALAITELLHGKSLGATNRAIQMVKDFSFDYTRLTIEGSPVAYSGSLQFTLDCVTRGL